jgi:hypothetical protein
MKDDLTDKMAESYQNNGMPIALKVSHNLFLHLFGCDRYLISSTLPMEPLEKYFHSSVDELLRIKV